MAQLSKAARSHRKEENYDLGIKRELMTEAEFEAEIALMQQTHADERRAWADSVEGLHKKIDVLTDAVKRRTRRIDNLECVLRVFGVHEESCAVYGKEATNPGCNCGLAAEINET